MWLKPAASGEAERERRRGRLRDAKIAAHFLILSSAPVDHDEVAAEAVRRQMRAASQKPKRRM